MNDKAYWIWLQQALGYSVIVDEIIGHFGNAKRVYEATPMDRALSGVFTKKQLEKMKETPLSIVDDVILSCRECGCRILTPDDENYPKKLIDLRNYPLVLYYYGKPEVIKDKMTIALVGTRKASRTGLSIASRLAANLVKSGAVVVSGGALGIDGAAHLGAVTEKGVTVAVLGCGFLAKYRDSYAALKNEIVETGVVFSEYAPRTPAIGRNFPVRNRIISALSYGVVVVEGALGSGSLITAQMAIDQGRELFAVPGDAINSQHSGTIELIRRGATPVFSCADIMAVYEFVYPDIIDYEKVEKSPLYENQFPMDFSKVTYGVKSVYSQETIPESVMTEVIEERLSREENEKTAEKLGNNEKTVYDVLSSEPMHIDDIMRKLVSLSSAKVMVSLTKLEMENLIASDNGKKYRRK